MMTRGWKRFWVASGLVLSVAILVAGINGYHEARSLGFLRDPVFETATEAVPELGHPAILVFSKTNAFIHKDAIPAAKAMITQLGGQHGWKVYTSDNGAIYNRRDLARFDVIVWNNVTGDVLLRDQRAAMQAWLEQGGGIIGLHAAGDSSHDAWPWYIENIIRARMIGHPLDPQFQQATLIVEQPADVIVGALGLHWQRSDEWYSFAASPRAADVRVLLTIDENTYVPEMWLGKSIRMGTDHPVMWKHCAGAGRVFYSALGHTAETYTEPEYRDVITRAIQWAGRMGQADTGAAGGLACESL